ncbi:HAD family hydrolase [Curtobacterium sp. VKM Ac-1376]|uniref:HAD family hydrolase n=1 Tax=Curtobacterium sp. VKM Ac-1376 TaxID=123312 RepID=UPI00188B5FE7|nr:HAD family hydrolase [Curtobacterium sp. VKM Ac-1376]MBF4616003.1 HAD family hydrolase [Curtobacterium sp. VKM Ac-1376]
MRRPELIVFDCDGVLVDSERIAVDIDVQILRELGWDITPEEFLDRFLGTTDEHYRSEIASRLHLPAGWETQFEDRFRTAFERDLRSVDGIEELLDALTLPVAVASNAPRPRLERNLALTGLLPRFGGNVFSADDVEHGKPAPDVYLHAAATVGHPPGGTVVVEDSRSGIAAARAAGMVVIGYAGGITPTAQLAEAHGVVADLRDVAALLDDPGFMP